MRVLIAAIIAALFAGCASDDYSLQAALAKSRPGIEERAASRQAYISSSQDSARLSIDQYKKDPSTSNLMDAGDALGDYQAAKYR